MAFEGRGALRARPWRARDVRLRMMTRRPNSRTPLASHRQAPLHDHAMLRWTRTIQLIAVLCLLASGPPAAAQAAAIAGVDAQRLRLGTDSLAISLIRDGDTIAIGRIWDELQLVHEGGEALLRRVYRSEDRVLGVRVDTLVDHHASLLPVRHRSRTSRSQEVLDFSDSQVLGWIRLTNGDSTSVDVALPTRMYAPGPRAAPRPSVQAAGKV